MKTRGFILLVVIALLGILVSVALVMVSSSQQSLQTSRDYLLAVRARVLARSGFDLIVEKYQENFISLGQSRLELPVGPGTFAANGDVISIKIKDFNGKININDGISAGNTETAAVLPPGSPLGIPIYFANALDPYPRGKIEDPTEQWYESEKRNNRHTTSAHINLRLRRILNAYGEVHRFVDQVYEGNFQNVSEKDYYKKPLPTPKPFTTPTASSADSPPGSSMAVYLEDDTIDPKENSGLGDQIIFHRPEGGYQDLDEIQTIVNQWAQSDQVLLSSNYLLKQTFFDLIKDDLTTRSYEDDNFYRFEEEPLGKFQRGNDLLGSFSPTDLQLINSIIQPSPANNHPIALINLNQASFFVRAAVFYAPTDVSYSVDGATSIPPYILDDASQYLLPASSLTQSLSPNPSIGVMGAVFDPDKKNRENGHDNQGREGHLMSLRDAMHLANAYQNYLNDGNLIVNFDDFKDFLIHHEKEGFLEGGIPPYEKVLVDNPYKTDEDFNAGGLFHIASYESQGIFMQDYVSKTLPHILSCVRRKPGFQGAPAALQSPYLEHKPAYDHESYKDRFLCQQGFRKCEDFVLKFMHPKVCFLPGGTLHVESVGKIKDSHEDILSAFKISGDLHFFDTLHYRTENNFRDTLTQPFDSANPNDFQNTHPDIVVGNQILYSFIGLKDYDQDTRDNYDLFMKASDYQPQIILNFSPDDSASPPLEGFENLSSSAISPDPMGVGGALTDLWGLALYPSYPDSLFGLGGLESPPLSQFNGVRLEPIRRGEFAGGTTFLNPLYWRLDDWLRAYPDTPIGEIFSKGLMTFWFQIPGNYKYPTVVETSDGHEIQSESFSQVIANLNFWESYQFEMSSPSIPRAVSLTVGLKTNQDRQPIIFARYESGGEYYDGSLSESYKIPPEFSPLESSDYQSQSEQYDFLGFWLNSSDLAYQEPDLNYSNYRQIAHRSYEVNVSLKNQPECAPGTWHRASVYWNLGWNERSAMRSVDQLLIDLHDQSNQNSIKEVNQGVVYLPTGQMPGDSFAYPASSGFMFPFNRSMILSLGDSHLQRFQPYSIKYFDDQGDVVEVSSFGAFAQGQMYPMWRFNSTIDNFRLWMGPQNSSETGDPSDAYFKPDFVSSTIENNLYGALRYKIIHQRHGFPETVEPKWVINPELLDGAQLYSIGSRIYYPPDSNNNVPYVYFSCSNEGATGDRLEPSLISKNEQNLIFDHQKVSGNFRMWCQYKAFQPLLDGSFENMEDKPLIYHGTDNWTNIPWIKEISIRYAPFGKPRLFSIEENDISTE